MDLVRSAWKVWTRIEVVWTKWLMQTLIKTFAMIWGGPVVTTIKAQELWANNFFNRWSLLIGLIVIVGLSAAAFFFSPKGENQTYVSFYLVWSLHVCAWETYWPAPSLIEQPKEHSLTQDIVYGEAHLYSPLLAATLCGVSTTTAAYAVQVARPVLTSNDSYNVHGTVAPSDRAEDVEVKTWIPRRKLVVCIASEDVAGIVRGSAYLAEQTWICTAKIYIYNKFMQNGLLKCASLIPDTFNSSWGQVS